MRPKRERGLSGLLTSREQGGYAWSYSGRVSPVLSLRGHATSVLRAARGPAMMPNISVGSAPETEAGRPNTGLAR